MTLLLLLECVSERTLTFG